MTFIFDMATGAGYLDEAPAERRADAVKAYHPEPDRNAWCIEPRLAIVESTPADRPSLAAGIDIAQLIRSLED